VNLTVVATGERGAASGRPCVFGAVVELLDPLADATFLGGLTPVCQPRKFSVLVRIERQAVPFTANVL
jgi:hypothetical protein